MRAISSSTTAWYTACAASLPQVKGPWLAQSTPGTCSGRCAGFERLDDDLAGILLVILVDFLRRQLPRAGDRAVKVIGVGGAEGGQVAPRLGKGYRVGRVGVHDAAQLREGPVQLEMRFGVAAGVQIALDLVAVQVHNNEHSGRQFVIFHAGRLMTNNPFSRSMPETLPQV